MLGEKSSGNASNFDAPASPIGNGVFRQKIFTVKEASCGGLKKLLATVCLIFSFLVFYFIFKSKYH